MGTSRFDEEKISFLANLSAVEQEVFRHLRENLAVEEDRLQFDAVINFPGNQEERRKYHEKLKRNFSSHTNFISALEQYEEFVRFKNALYQHLSKLENSLDDTIAKCTQSTEKTKRVLAESYNALNDKRFIEKLLSRNKSKIPQVHESLEGIKIESLNAEINTANEEIRSIDKLIKKKIQMPAIARPEDLKGEGEIESEIEKIRDHINKLISHRGELNLKLEGMINIEILHEEITSTAADLDDYEKSISLFHNILIQTTQQQIDSIHNMHIENMNNSADLILPESKISLSSDDKYLNKLFETISSMIAGLNKTYRQESEEIISNEYDRNKLDVVKNITLDLKSKYSKYIEDNRDVILRHIRPKPIANMLDISSYREELTTKINRLDSEIKSFTSAIKKLQQRKNYLELENRFGPIYNKIIQNNGIDTKLASLSDTLKEKLKKELLNQISKKDISPNQIESTIVIELDQLLPRYQFLSQVIRSCDEYRKSIVIDHANVDDNINLTGSIKTITSQHKYAAAGKILSAAQSILTSDSPNSQECVRAVTQTARSGNIAKILKSHQDTAGSKLLAIITLGVTALLKKTGLWKPKSARLLRSFQNDPEHSPKNRGPR